MDAQTSVHPHLTVDASSWFTSRFLEKSLFPEAVQEALAAQEEAEISSEEHP